jgi:hypothetical protein
MTFELVRRTRTVMLMMPVWPESGFWDVPRSCDPLAEPEWVLVVLM